MNDSTVGLYRVDGGRWSSLPAGSVTVDTTTRTVGTNVSGSLGTYGAFAGNVSNGTGNGSLPLGARLFPNGIPAGTGDAPPTDTDGDGLLEDLDGNGAFEFVDVIEFVFALQRGDYSSTALSSAQIAALDLDSNGRVTFVDVIALVFEI
jgi:PKD repeat protein